MTCWLGLCAGRQLHQLATQLSDDMGIPTLITQPNELFLFMRQFTTDLVKACGLAECTGGQGGEQGIGAEECDGAVILLGRDEPVPYLFRQLPLEDVAFMENHPDNKSQHAGVTQIVSQQSQQETAAPSHQCTEGVVECMREHRHRVPGRYSEQLHQRVVIQAGNRQSNACKGGEERMHPANQQHTD